MLYEDLRLELLAAAENKISALDKNGVTFRKQYFMRRAFATTVEFAEGFRLLDELPEFEGVKKQFPPDALAEWYDCVTYFREHEPAIERIRNDVGGHFGLPVALAAVKSLRPDQEGKIKIRFDLDKRKGSIWYEFAGEIAATAMLRHKRAGESSEECFRRTLEVLLGCFERAIRMTDLITNYYAIDRFR